MQQQFIEYSHAGTVLEGFLANPARAGERRPAVLVAHAWAGRDDFVIGKAKALAGLGYAAFALDNYGKGVLGANNEENSALIGPFMGDRALLRDRLRAGLQTLRAQPGVDPERIAIMGYCFGGLCALDLARSGADIRGAISFHGLLLPNGLDPQPIKARVLALHGYADPMVPPEQVVAFGKEMTDAGVDWQLHAYGGVLHAFTVPEANDPGFGTVYNASAERRSWRALVDFLEEIFP
jgi:dienelactone hydrolase